MSDVTESEREWLRWAVWMCGGSPSRNITPEQWQIAKPHVIDVLNRFINAKPVAPVSSNTIILSDAISDDLDRAEIAQLRADLAQRDKDWDALMVLIAQTVGDEDERAAADDEQMEEFDPWRALRRFHRSHLAQAAVVEAAVEWSASFGELSKRLPPHVHALRNAVDEYEHTLRAAKGER